MSRDSFENWPQDPLSARAEHYLDSKHGHWVQGSPKMEECPPNDAGQGITSASLGVRFSLSRLLVLPRALGQAFWVLLSQSAGTRRTLERMAFALWRCPPVASAPRSGPAAVAQHRCTPSCLAEALDEPLRPPTLRSRPCVSPTGTSAPRHQYGLTLGCAWKLFPKAFVHGSWGPPIRLDVRVECSFFFVKYKGFVMGFCEVPFGLQHIV